MATVKTIAMVNRRGGTGKTTLSHLLAQGCERDNWVGYLLHTDNREQLELSRGYGYEDCRTEAALRTTAGKILEVSEKTGLNSLIIVDVGGNQLADIRTASLAADIVIMPVGLDREGYNTAKETYETLKTIGTHHKLRIFVNKRPTDSDMEELDYKLLKEHENLTGQPIIGSFTNRKAISRVVNDDEDLKLTSMNPTTLKRVSGELWNMLKDHIA